MEQEKEQNKKQNMEQNMDQENNRNILTHLEFLSRDELNRPQNQSFKKNIKVKIK